MARLELVLGAGEAANQGCNQHIQGMTGPDVRDGSLLEAGPY
jgi:hypothetical protein